MLVVVSGVEREYTADGVRSAEKVGRRRCPRIRGPSEDALAVREAQLERFDDPRFVPSRLLEILGTGVGFTRGAPAERELAVGDVGQNLAGDLHLVGRYA